MWKKSSSTVVLQHCILVVLHLQYTPVSRGDVSDTSTRLYT